MSLLQRIKDDQLNARKMKAVAKASTLTLIIADAEKKAKDEGNREVTDTDVLGVIRKHINGVEVYLAPAMVTKLDSITRLAKELELHLLKEYLPKQLNEDQMISVMQVLKISKTEMLTMPVIMQHFKDQYPGQYDGKQLSAVALNFIRSMVK